MVETVVELVYLQMIALNVHALVEVLEMEILIPSLEMVFAMVILTTQDATMIVVTAVYMFLKDVSKYKNNELKKQHH